MYKHPLHYKKENIEEIMNKQITIDIGLKNSDTVTETIHGLVVNCTLASNEPFLPASITVETAEGKTRTFSMFEIKMFRD
ncbi:hypothetical protein [Flavobacterium sp. 3HN19-14]|uniref:hypothetical protein n=1 Tax=Flavobacterium sp. 3HN19-14 TaxID=3448133 RepID=UPI003EE37BDF